MFKLGKNIDHYLLELSKIECLVGYFTGIAFDQVDIRINKNGTIDFVITNNLTTYLEITFGDLDKKSTFQRNHQKLRWIN